ncbi:MAG: hypothetical protein GXY41_12050 [Phycisphaerae bacterium]|nr:hypothetical protein [Phycisphaerae bacterium]
MKLGPVIHQQIVQLKWHVLACLGLVMAMPLEEAVMNAWQGEGFYAGRLSLFIPIIAAPLLAGLIACANVQADLDDKRYLFWRSRPAGVKTFMSIKFLIGMVTALIIIACPFVFAFVTCQIVQTEKNEREFFVVIAVFQLISLLTYSVCFFCNVLIRKTARAWLVGMAAACLMMVLPFILPFHFKDIVGDVLVVTSAVYLSITIGSSALAFALSLVAADRNWHLHTNLKGLLWAGAAIVFLLAMLFSRQVANIKVLDEIKLESGWGWDAPFYRIDDRLYFHGRQEIQTSDGRIKVFEAADWFKTERSWTVNDHNRPDHSEQKLELRTYPALHAIYRRINGQLYAFALHIYSKRGMIEYKHAYLRSFKVLNDELFPVSTLDVSECLASEEDSFNRFAIRLIDDKIIAFVGNQCLSAAVNESGEIELLDREPLTRYHILQKDRNRIIQIPLIKTDTIDFQERIRFALDYTYKPSWIVGDSIVDIHNNTIRYYLVSDQDVARYEVLRWDDDYIYCRFQSARPFTFLEQLDRGRSLRLERYFIRNGKLYAHGMQKLMVFDVRSERIRKLGHWERLTDNFGITDMEVLEDGNLVMAVSTGWHQHTDGVHYATFTMYVLKNPE